MQPHRGPLILALGIIACCGALMFTGLPAWFMANRDLRLMSRGLMDSHGLGLTVAGKVCGIVGTGLTAAALITAVVLVS